MKKVGYFVLGLAIFSLVISFFSILGLFPLNSFAQTETWERVDLLCPDDKYEKTNCYKGGLEQCEVVRCPKPI